MHLWGACGENGYAIHTVAPAESVACIADFYGISQNDLRELNGLKKGRPLQIGDALQIPKVLRGTSAKSHVVKTNSLPVHMDVRDKSLQWTDFSDPGETPRYKKRGNHLTAEVEGDRNIAEEK